MAQREIINIARKYLNYFKKEKFQIPKHICLDFMQKERNNRAEKMEDKNANDFNVFWNNN